MPAASPHRMAKRDPSNKQRFVVVGGGAAGLNCVEALRQGGFTGEVLMVSAENTLPLDRTLLNKVVGGDPNNFVHRNAEFFKEAEIDVKLETQVTAIDRASKKITLNDGTQVSYDKLCLATGGSARKIPVPGADLPQVHVIRTAADLNNLKRDLSTAKSVAIIGASFIGSEVAASIKSNDSTGEKQVHLIDTSAVPLERVMGSDIGSLVLSQH